MIWNQWKWKRMKISDHNLYGLLFKTCRPKEYQPTLYHCQVLRNHVLDLRLSFNCAACTWQIVDIFTIKAATKVILFLRSILSCLIFFLSTDFTRFSKRCTYFILAQLKESLKSEYLPMILRGLRFFWPICLWIIAPMCPPLKVNKAS